jgi:tripartite-type tricarboxylate transporter receptor subunit TctC
MKVKYLLSRNTSTILLCALAWSTAHAQAPYPTKPIHLVIAFSAGAAVDTVSRILGAGLGSLGQPVIVENKPGAAGIVGTDFVAKAAPDGYTLLSGTTAAFAIVPHITAKLPFDPVKDFQAVAPFARSASLLVINPALPVNTMKEFIAYAKERPGKLNYASNGNGGTLHLAMEMFSTMAGIRMTHVPYNNLTVGMTHVASGELQAMFISPTNAMPLVQAGRLRALAIGTSHRSEMVPSIPTVDEEGLKGFGFSTWFGLFAPAGTPRHIVNALNAAVNASFAQAEIADRLKKSAAEKWPGAPEELATLARAELEMYGKVAREIRLQKQ